MKSYLSYFILRFKMNLQYRAAAISGIITQFFFGFIQIFIYLAFYESGSGTLPMPINQLVSFVWFSQAFFAIIYLWQKDKEIILMIKNGNISYELCRPQNLYFMWMAKILGQRLANLTLRFLPIILVAIILPEPYRMSLAITLPNFIIFIISLLLSFILMVLIAALCHIGCIFTIDDRGIINIAMVIADLFSGLVIPIPFFPKAMQVIANILPFRYISDFPFRFYVGNIPQSEAIYSIFIQIIWIIVLFFLGKIMMGKALKKAVIQGG